MLASLSPRVVKFGGSSVGSAGTLRQLLDIVEREQRVSADGDDAAACAPSPAPPAPAGGLRAVSLVVSAMGPSTDLLLQAVREAGEGAGGAAEATAGRVAALAVSVAVSVASAEAAAGAGFDASASRAAFSALVDGVLAPALAMLRTEAQVRTRSPALRDAVVAHGERVSVAVVVALLRARGVRALAVDACEWLLTDDAFGAARVDVAETSARARAAAAAWPAGAVAVHTGFIAATADGRVTTLGRNGSDYTAALLAAALRAGALTVWTDVPGVLTADPTLVAEAYPVRHLSHGEALELANLGFTMFHPRTMVPLMAAGIPLRIRSTAALGDAGTLVDATGSDRKSVV